MQTAFQKNRSTYLARITVQVPPCTFNDAQSPQYTSDINGTFMVWFVPAAPHSDAVACSYAVKIIFKKNDCRRTSSDRLSVVLGQLSEASLSNVALLIFDREVQ